MSGVTGLDLAGERFIAGWEGGQSSDGMYRAYWDSYGRTWTIGIGETGGVEPGMVWTADEAWANLRERFARDFAPAILSLRVELNHNQFNAAADAVWNLGSGSVEWDWGRALRARDFELSAHLLRNYDHAGGVLLSGLARRRAAEAMLMLTPEPVVKRDPYEIFPTSVLRYHGHWFEERRLAERIDRQLRHRDLRGLRHDLPIAKAAKTRIWVVSVNEPPHYRFRRSQPDWGEHRGERYQLWVTRIRQIEARLAGK